MPADYDKIREDNIRRRGEEFDDIGRLISEQLYSDRSHFVYELLQNAEDALARRFRINPNDNVPRKVQFRLFPNRLEFRHFGAPFNEEDVKGISDVLKGTKREDMAHQIGKFGIGFKSVYAFTSSPEIHSGEEHFIIKRYIRPEAKEATFQIEENETVFNLPFDHEELGEKAFDLILEKLQSLGSRVLLFLRWIDEIEWSVEPDGEKGQYRKETKEIRGCTDARRITVLGQNNDKDEEENWLIFGRSVAVPGKSEEVRVEVSFLLEAEDKAKKKPERIIKVKDSPLVAYFPTEKLTGCGFLIQGPYSTTSSRDNILKDDDWNETLVEETAELIREILPEIKKLDLLSVSFLEALPIKTEHFPEDSMFYPIFVSVRNVLIEDHLLPADDGSYVPAGNSKLARGAELRKLLDHEQLRFLFNTSESIKWLVGDITLDRTPELRSYLISELGVEEVTQESFVRKVDAAFFENQSDEWMISFYAQLQNQKTIWKKGTPSSRNPSGPLRKKPFIRLEDNSHVKPFDFKDNPNAYLPPKGLIDSRLPTVKKTIADCDDARIFLQDDLKLPEFDIVAEVIEHILPKYTFQSSPQTDEHRQDINRILEAYNTDSQEKKTRLKKNLQEISFILSSSPISTDEVYRKPNDLYFQNDSLKIYFSGNPEVKFVSSIYPKSAMMLFETLGVSSEIKVKCKSIFSSNDYVDLDYRSGHRRGLYGFDPDIEIDGLEQALSRPSNEKSQIIWNKIGIPYSHCIKGKVIISSRQDFSPNASKYDEEEIISEKFGRLLIDSEWLPTSDGEFHCPADISLNDLPVQFEKDEKLADLLGMKKTEKVQAADILSGGNPHKRELIEQIANASEDELHKFRKLVPEKNPPTAPPSFSEGLKRIVRQQHGCITTVQQHDEDHENHQIRNFERYLDKCNEAVANAIEEHSKTSQVFGFSPVRNRPDNKEAREFLYNEYQGRCQITGDTFPKASSNAEGISKNYFEACSLLSYSNADYLNDAGNMLCVSADTLAKLKYASFEWLDDIQDKIDEFENEGGKSQYISLRIKLAEEKCTITWSQRHFMRLVALYKEA